MRFRLIDTEGNAVGELPDAEATWGVGDMVSLDGQDLKVVGLGGLTVADLAAGDLAVLVVEPV
jgi:hypothetical protein